MESRKMALMDLFAAQAQRCRHREQTCGHSEGRKGGGRAEKTALTHMHYHVWNRQLVEAATLHREFSLVLYDDLER